MYKKSGAFWKILVKLSSGYSKSQKALRFRAFHFSITEFWLYTATLKKRLTTTIPLQKVILSTKD
jgi:hypothetical protein